MKNTAVKILSFLCHNAFRTKVGVIISISSIWIALLSTFVMPVPDLVRWILRSDSIEQRLQLVFDADTPANLRENINRLSSLVERQQKEIREKDILLEAISQEKLLEHNSKDQDLIGDDIISYKLPIPDYNQVYLDYRPSGSYQSLFSDNLRIKWANMIDCSLAMIFFNKDKELVVQSFSFAGGAPIIRLIDTYRASFEFIAIPSGILQTDCSFRMRVHRD